MHNSGAEKRFVRIEAPKSLKEVASERIMRWQKCLSVTWAPISDSRLKAMKTPGLGMDETEEDNCGRPTFHG